jgi:hypothetical protein
MYLTVVKWAHNTIRLEINLLTDIEMTSHPGNYKHHFESPQMHEPAGRIQGQSQPQDDKM